MCRFFEQSRTCFSIAYFQSKARRPVSSENVVNIYFKFDAHGLKSWPHLTWVELTWNDPIMTIKLGGINSTPVNLDYYNKAAKLLTRFIQMIYFKFYIQTKPALHWKMIRSDVRNPLWASTGAAEQAAHRHVHRIMKSNIFIQLDPVYIWFLVPFLLLQADT